MAKTVGLDTRQDKSDGEIPSLAKENKKLQAELEKVFKEKKKAEEENKVLKKEMTQLKKKKVEQLSTPEVSEGGE